MRYVVRGIVGLCLALSVVASAQAHAVRGAALAADNAQAVVFRYSDGEPAAYAAVEIYSPDNAKVEYQGGRTDAAGVFAFVPNKSGTWTAVMTDGMGHKATHAVNVTLESVAPMQATVPTPSSEQNTSTLVRAILGVSLLLNLFAGLALYRRRKETKHAYQ